MSLRSSGLRLLLLEKFLHQVEVELHHLIYGHKKLFHILEDGIDVGDLLPLNALDFG